MTNGRASAVRSLLLTAATVGILFAVLWPRRYEIDEAIARVPAVSLALLAGLHLLALVLRAEAWGTCVAAAGAPVERQVLHPVSALRFLADTVVPTYIGAWVRIGLLRKMHPERAPTIGQMVVADGVLLAVEAAILVVIVGLAVATAPVPWWWLALMIGLAAGALAVCLLLRRRFAGRPWARTLDVLTGAPRRAVLVGLLAVVLLVQPLRMWIAVEAIGVDGSFTDAVLVFVATSVFNAVPVGPGPANISALAAVFHGAGLAAAAAAGLIVAATAVMAAGVYSLWGIAVMLLGSARRRRSVAARPVPEAE